MRQIGSWIVVVVIMAVIAGLIIHYASPAHHPASTPRSRVTQSQAPQPPLDSTLVIGKPTAPITITEYSDYKCPECNKQFQGAGKMIREQYVDKGIAKIVFRMYPVFGEDAGLALYGSYCANDQGVFPAYHDAMFSYMSALYAREGNYQAASRNILTPDVIVSVAKRYVKNVPAFQNCLNQKTHQAEFDAVMRAAASDRVNGTPTLVIGGHAVVGNQPYAIYRALLEAANAGA